METLIYVCPNCGGGLHFDPASQNYECEYCLSQFEQGSFEQTEQQEHPEQVDARESEAVFYQCPACGAELITEDTTAATFCFYCHNPVVLSGKLGGAFSPDAIIPFTIDKEKILEIFEEWIKKQKYLPNDFYSPQQMEKMSGVYFPYWIYDCKIDGKMSARCEQRRVWSSGSTEYTEVKSYHVVREGVIDVNGVSRNALKKADKRLVDAVLPFDTSKRKPFSMGFLTGFLAEKRNIEKEEYQPEVVNEVKEFANSSLRGSLGSYHQVSIDRNELSVLDEKWNYVLFPVWTLTYQDRRDNKIYYFACNGQTGKVSGEIPADPKKLIRLFVTIFVPVLLFLLIGGYFI